LNTGTPNASTTCDYSNGVGLPRYLNATHNTIVASLTSAAPASAQTVPTANFPRNTKIVDNIFTGGGVVASGGEGTYVTDHYFDTGSLIYHHNVQADRAIPAWQANTVYRIGDVIKPSSPSRRYVAVTNGTSGAVQPTFSNSGNSCNTDNTVVWQNLGLLPAQYGGGYDYTEYLTTGAIGVRPPATISFPAHAYCYGATADSSCVGFKGGLSAPATGTNSCTAGTQVPVVNIQPVFGLTDWHDYALHTSSVFRGQASDGKDLGADVSAIDAAQTRTQYVCSSNCGEGPHQN
jgi:hypothetical protein